MKLFNRTENYWPADKAYTEPFIKNIENNEIWGDQVLEYTIDYLVEKYGEKRAKEIIAEVLGLEL